MFVARLAFFSLDWKEKGVGQVSRAIEFYGKNELWGYVSECVGSEVTQRSLHSSFLKEKMTEFTFTFLNDRGRIDKNLLNT